MAISPLIHELAASDLTTARVEELSSALDGVAADLQGLGQDWLSEKLRGQIYEVILSCIFAGMYTMLVLFAAYLLSRKGLQHSQTLIMLMIILALYISTTVYWATLLAETFHELRSIISNIFYEGSRVSTVVENFRQVVLDNGSATIDSGFSSAVQDQLKSWWPRPTQECAGTATLTFNVVIGDAVVWWRALVLWKRCPFRRCAYSCLLVCITLIPGAIVTTHGCRASASPVILTSGEGTTTITSGSFYIRDTWGLVASVFSLLANAVSTSLIAYKAWDHRKLVRMSLGSGSTRSRVERSLGLLVESGSIYCLLWLFIVVYQACAITLTAPTFIYRFHFFVEGCLIALIGIYPTLIIILVAMNQSQCEATLSGTGESSSSTQRFSRFSRFSHAPSSRATESNASHCILRLNPIQTANVMSWRAGDADLESKLAEDKRRSVATEATTDMV
ncbi:hypothetical protein C8Q80DRAFT_459599 [Daedaleopsis nitida]|nr:hypothetical protein C8Q80DRAFT_459599 [Daedaleopsis nitida]